MNIKALIPTKEHCPLWLHLLAFVAIVVVPYLFPYLFPLLYLH